MLKIFIIIFNNIKILSISNFQILHHKLSTEFPFGNNKKLLIFLEHHRTSKFCIFNRIKSFSSNILNLFKLFVRCKTQFSVISRCLYFWFYKICFESNGKNKKLQYCGLQLALHLHFLCNEKLFLFSTNLNL